MPDWRFAASNVGRVVTILPDRDRADPGVLVPCLHRQTVVRCAGTARGNVGGSVGGVDSPASKEEMRAWASSIDHSAYSKAVVQNLVSWPPLAGVVVGFVPMALEIDVICLHEEPGVRFVAPRVETDGSMTIRAYDPDDLDTHRYGFDQPGPDSELVDDADIDVVLSPGLVFDEQGGRLGRGGGYYDRLLERIPESTARVGVTSRGAVIDAVPMDAHDARVDWLVTETGIDWSGQALPEPAQRVMQSAIANGVAPRMRGFPEGTRTSADAARAVGCELGAIAKSLVFEVDGTPVLVLCSGDRRVDETKLAALRGGSIAKPASRDRVLEITGYPAGGTPAMGHRTRLDVVADVSLARYGYVWSAGGTVDTVYPVALERLVAASAARWADISTRG